MQALPQSPSSSHHSEHSHSPRPHGAHHTARLLGHHRTAGRPVTRASARTVGRYFAKRCERMSEDVFQKGWELHQRKTRKGISVPKNSKATNVMLFANKMVLHIVCPLSLNNLASSYSICDSFFFTKERKLQDHKDAPKWVSQPPLPWYGERVHNDPPLLAKPKLRQKARRKTKTFDLSQ